MSVINRVLKDLDRQGRTPGQALPGIQIPATHVPVSRDAWWRVTGMTLAALALLFTLWWIWPKTPAFKSPSPPTRLPTPTSAVTLPPTATLPPVNNPPVHRTPPEERPAPPPSLPVTRTLHAPEPSAPSPPLRHIAAHFSVASRLEMRLPEIPAARPSPAPLPAANKTQINKEIRPLGSADQAEDLWRQGRRLHEQGRIHEARSHYEQALLSDAQHLRARQSLAVVCLESGQRGKAEEVLREGMARHPGESWFLRSLAQMQIQQGDYAQAAGVLKTGLAPGKNSPSGDAADWALYASTLGKLGRMEDCVHAYREALRRDPAQGAWWIGLGVALEHTGHRPEAADAYTRALQSRLGSDLKEFATQKVQEIGKSS